MFTVSFWKQVAERAVKSFVQGAIVVGGFISPDGVFSGDALQGAVGLAVASVLTSLASSFKGDAGSASAIN